MVARINFGGLDLFGGTLNSTLQVGAEEDDSIVITAKSANIAGVGAVILAGGSVSGALSAGDLIINTAAIQASGADDVGYRCADSGATAVAAAINGNGTYPGVCAVANPTITGVSEFEGSVNTVGRVLVNGVAVSVISVDEHTGENVTDAVNAVESLPNETGVIAFANDDGRLVFAA